MDRLFLLQFARPGEMIGVGQFVPLSSITPRGVEASVPTRPGLSHGHGPARIYTTGQNISRFFNSVPKQSMSVLGTIGIAKPGAVFSEMLTLRCLASTRIGGSPPTGGVDPANAIRLSRARVCCAHAIASLSERAGGDHVRCGKEPLVAEGQFLNAGTLPPW